MASPLTLLAAGPLAAVILLGGCPPPAHYLTADVTMARVPVEGALVAGECGYAHSAKVTNAEGRARLRFYGNVDAGTCVVTVGVPDLAPIESHDASLCTAPDACPALTFEFADIPNASPFVTSENERGRSYRHDASPSARDSDAYRGEQTAPTPTELEHSYSIEQPHAVRRPYATPPHRAEVAR